MTSTADIVIVGGGLAGGLTALQLATAHPERKIVLVEAANHLGGKGTWSFHENDVSKSMFELLKPMITKSWTRYSVRFPKLERTIESSYHAIRSEDFDRVIRDRLGSSVRLQSKARNVLENEVQLESGETITAICVFDARGLDRLPPPRLNGFQKFLSLDIKLEGPHGLESPWLVDATCPQLDGLRFFKVLPMAEDRLTVEEIYYSDVSELNYERISKSIRSYVERRGWKIASIDREERSAQPAPMTAAYLTSIPAGEPIMLGHRAGYFHAMTGQSLPDTARFAEFLATIPELSSTSAREGLTRFRRSWLNRQRFYRVVNRIIFYASEPSLRFLVLHRLYEFPQDLIERFYGGRSTWTDRLRLLSGGPPVPLQRALKSLTERLIQDRAGVER